MRFITTFLFVTLAFLVHGQSEIIESSEVNDTISEDPYGIFDIFKGTSGKAGLYSLILPGSGQLYNKRYWKVPLFVGAEAGAIAILIYNIDVYNEWNDGYQAMANGTADNVFGLTDISTVRTIRDSKRQNKDYAWIGLIAVHIITAADAFVDRHLIEFDVEDDIAVKFSPIAPYPGINFVVSF